MAYLTQSDITDKVAIPFIGDANTDIQTYLDKGDAYIESLAQARGVLDFTLIQLPLVIELKEYGLAKLYCELFADVMNVNNNEAFEQDKYQNKMEYYKGKAKEYYKMITKEMITGEVKDLTDRHANSFNMWRA